MTIINNGYLWTKYHNFSTNTNPQAWPSSSAQCPSNPAFLPVVPEKTWEEKNCCCVKPYETRCETLPIMAFYVTYPWLRISCSLWKLPWLGVYTFEHCQVDFCTTNSVRVGVLKGIWYQPRLMPTQRQIWIAVDLAHARAENLELYDGSFSISTAEADDYCKTWVLGLSMHTPPKRNIMTHETQYSFIWVPRTIFKNPVLLLSQSVY